MSAPSWAPPAPNLETQLLTEERVAWIWDVSPRTVRDWRRQGTLNCVKKGKNVVRYQPCDIAQDILAHYRATARPPVTGMAGPEDPSWQCMARLVQTAVESWLAGAALGSGQPARARLEELVHNRRRALAPLSPLPGPGAAS